MNFSFEQAQLLKKGGEKPLSIAGEAVAAAVAAQTTTTVATTIHNNG
jgi:hypothetical protein